MITKQLSYFSFGGLLLTQFSFLLQFMALSAQPGLGGHGSTHSPQNRKSSRQHCLGGADAKADSLARCCREKGLAFLLSPDSMVPPPPPLLMLAIAGLGTQLRGGSPRDCDCWSGCSCLLHHGISTITP